jgi:hypothetical protein
MLPDESPAEYADLVQSVYDEYIPQTETEHRLAHSLIQHYWLTQRAIRLQEETITAEVLDQKKLSLFMRYQSLHERSHYKAQKELKTIQKERTKEQNGFESQKRQQAANEAKTRLANAKAEAIEIETECKKMMEGLVPGATKIGFEQLTRAYADAMAALVHENQSKTAA